MDFDDAVGRVSTSIRSIVFSVIPNATVDVSIDSDGTVTVDISGTREIRKLPVQAIEEAVNAICGIHGKKIARFTWPSKTTLNFISSVEVIRAVKILQPATISKIRDAISARRGEDTELSRLPAALDRCRQSGHILRNPNGAYLLTAKGLRALPSTSGRESSDIQRVLELGRRGRYTKPGR